jgi:hypothetical protein
MASCSCAALCGCPVDAQPKDAAGGSECRGVAVFHIADGRLDEVDLSGVDFAFYNLFPSNLTSGNWKVGVVVDSGASDAQAEAVGRILSGQEGGTFGELAQFVGEFLGTERGRVTLSDGDKPALSVEGHSELEFEAARGADGTPTTVKNAMFGFAPEFQVGRTSGRSSAFGLSFEPSYGESADFTFTSEKAEAAVAGRM